MSVSTTYACDRIGCDHSQETGEQMWEIGVSLRHLSGGVRFQSGVPSHYMAIWCRNCVIKFGLLPAKDPVKTPAKPITLEDMVREIVQEEIDASA